MIDLNILKPILIKTINKTINEKIEINIIDHMVYHRYQINDRI